MNVHLPIHFTENGIGWRNRPRLVHIRYLSGIEIDTNQFTLEHTNMGPCEFEMTNGYYYEGNERIRITNYVGYDGRTFIKRCPHCGQDKALTEFDYIGRYDETRDQSNCNECRGAY